MRNIPVKPDTDFDWYNPHFFQGAKLLNKVFLINASKGGEFFVILLFKFASSLSKKSYTFHSSVCVKKIHWKLFLDHNIKIHSKIPTKPEKKLVKSSVKTLDLVWIVI